MLTFRESGVASRVMTSGLALCSLIWACNASQLGCDDSRVAHAERSWRLAIRVPDSVREGDTVPLALVLQNMGDSAIGPHLGLSSDADFVVTRPGGTTPVWRKFHGLEIRMGTSLANVIAPGDSIRIKDRWDQRGNDGEPVKRGVYCVRGNLDTKGLKTVWTDVATFRIVP